MATVSKTINRKSGAKIIVTMTRDVVDNIAYADGANVKLGTKNHEWTEIIMVASNGKSVKGNKVTILDPKFHAAEIAKGAYAQIAPKAYMSLDAYNEVIAALAELDAELGKSDEFVANEQAEAAKAAKVAEAIRQADAEDAARERTTGWCKVCRDWTYGDCGHATR
jgi:hypothetical protein